MKTMLEHKDANVLVEELPNGKNKISVELINDDLFMPVKTCQTSYPVGLIDQIMCFKGPAYLCDEILRDESPDYVEKALKYDLLAYRMEEDFADKRLLDFGCGSGASTMVLARMFPRSEIVGVELEEKLLAIARLRAAHYGFRNVQLMISPNPESLPPHINNFDYVVFSAVYEHLLPKERETVLPRIWNLLKPGGILFINQTPGRYFPVETHTTSGLPLINYLPDRLAHYYARHFSRRKLRNFSWEELLRKGIRGGSVAEIIRILNRCSATPILLRPYGFGIHDRIDLWYIQSGWFIQAGKDRFVVRKKFVFLLVKMLKRLTGVTIVPKLSLAIQKAA